MTDDLDVMLKNLDININAAVRRAAAEIGEKIQEEYEAIITKFYMSYDPKMYDRTYSLYEGAKGVGGYGKYQRQLMKNMYECGINVGAENYSGNPYAKNPPHGLDVDPSIVFPNAWDLGRHGFSSWNVRLNHMRANESGAKPWRVRRTPKNSTPPKKKMAEAFKKYDNEAYVNGVIIKHIGDLGGL